MIILFPKRKGVKISLELICAAMRKGASYHYVLGMLDFAADFGAITPKEKQALLEYLEKRG